MAKYDRHGPTKDERRATLAEQCQAWIESGPGAFSDHDMNKAVEKAYAAFVAFSGSDENSEFFEEVLKEATGYWLGGIGVNGSYLWLLWLPSKRNTEHA